MDFERKRRDIKTLYDSFGDKVDKDVIDMVYAECGNKVMEAIDGLVLMSGESPNTLPVTPGILVSDSVENPSDLSARGTSALTGPIDSINGNPAIKTQKPNRIEIETPDEADGFAVVSKSKQRSTSRKSNQEVDANDQKLMYIMRGLPGSGKSYRARELKGKSGVVLSTDDYFEKNGRFLFNPKDLKEAHAWNQTRAKIATDNNVSPVVIDNTNTQAWEMQPYASMAIKNGYSVVICEPKTPWSWNIDELTRRNSHGVPYEKIAAMFQRYEHGITLDLIMQSNGPQDHKLPPQSRNTTVTRASSYLAPHQYKSPPKNIFQHRSFRHPQSLGYNTGGFKIQVASNTHVAQYPRTQNINDLDVIMTDDATDNLNQSVMPDCIPKQNLLLKPAKAQPTSPMSNLIVQPPTGSEDSPIDILSADDVSPVECNTPKHSSDKNTIEAEEMLLFLKSCFPDITQTMLANILKVNNEDVIKTCDELLKDTVFIDLQDDEDENDIDRRDIETNNDIDMNQGPSTQTQSKDVPLALNDEPSLPTNVLLPSRNVITKVVPSAVKDQPSLPTNVPLAVQATTRPTDATTTQGTLGLSDKSSQDQLIVKMDENLCLQLKEFYGYNSETVGWDVSDTVVHIPLDLGEQLYRALETSIKTQKTKKEILEQRDEIYAQQLQLYDECSKPSSSTEIKQDNRKEAEDAFDGGKRSWASTTHGSAAEYRAAEQKRKRIKLFNTFPGIDEEALLQILEANGYDLELSIQLAATSCGVSLNSVPKESNASDYVIIPSAKPSPKSNDNQAPITYNRRDKSPVSPATRPVTIPGSPSSRFQIAENPKYADFRAEAQIHFDMRKRYLAQAAKAYGEKRGLIANYYADKAREQYDKMQEANMRAAAMILSKNQEIISQQGDENVLDIHGLHVSEALLIVEHYLKLAANTGKKSVSVVTGRGIHSKGGVARLKPAILKYLRKHGIRHYLKDGGRLIVYV